jgi:hypothetical protein
LNVPTRNEVYAVIDGERSYQEWIWRNRCEELGVPHTSDTEKSVEVWLVFITGYYHDAIQEASHVAEGGDVLHIVRKLAGLCVACMESNGGWERKNDGSFGTYYPGQLPRKTVYHMIDAERDYQETLPAERTDGREHSINGYLVMFGHYLREAFRAWTTNPGDAAALQSIVKLAGIAAHCLEDHGAPRRAINAPVFKRQSRLRDWVNTVQQKLPWVSP